MGIKTATLNGVATIEIARPEKKNALTTAMYQAMADALRAAADDKAVRAVLITGSGKGFCSGADLSARSSDSKGGSHQALQNHYNPAISQLIRANVPGPVFEMLEAFRKNSPTFTQLVAEYQFIKQYRAAWGAWHASGAPLYLGLNPQLRPFAAPAEMLP